MKDMSKYSPFCRKVWAACFKIPAGETRSYGEIAEAIGHVGAARAVGSALALNPFAPIVPCHRVIRKDGTMGGYSGRGGIKAKRRLLEKERR